ncbi:MAG TPA: hypothetical protein VGR64_05770 [Terracidiphilus sp.]|nr:hypothetical protein [Terracidiphilus sp.]
MLHDGTVVSGSGEFRHDGELLVQGKVTLRNLTLHLHGPIRVAAGATLTITNVHLVIYDPDNAVNGTSGLTCDGPARILIQNSTMVPAGSAHPMWSLKGRLDVDGFTTSDSEFHLDHVQARLNNLKIFELEISHESRVTARGLDLVFLSTHTSNDEHLHFENIPSGRIFTRTLQLGSGAQAQLKATRIQFFLLYMHGRSSADLARMDRVQLAVSPDCEGTLRLPKGQLGTAEHPAVFPEPNTSTCPFRVTLNDVNVDTWDVYAGAGANLAIEDSQIDELVASDHARIEVRDSNVYADWLSIGNSATVRIEDSTVGALRLAKERPDLATSQVRVTGHGHAEFSKVRFDCGIVADEDASVILSHSVQPPAYVHWSGRATVGTESEPETDNTAQP